MDMDAIHPIQPPNFPAGLHVKVEMLTQSRLSPFPSPFRPPGKPTPDLNEVVYYLPPAVAS